MPKTFRPLITGLIALVALGLVAPPAGAADSLSRARERREEARRKRAEIASQLDHLKASDAQLEGAVSVLSERVRAQEASAEAARQSAEAARAAVADAENRIVATENVMRGIRSAVVSRAVAAYVRPPEDSITTVISSEDIGQASRRTVLLSQVANHDMDVLDRLRAASQDLRDAKDRLQKARELAEKRRTSARDRLNELVSAQQEQQRLAVALQGRISEYQAEADAVAREEAGLSALIRSREQARASAGRRLAGDVSVDARVSGSGLIWPVRGPVTSPYGQRWGRLHAGIDIGAGTGVPIRAAKAGEVVFSGTMSGYGNVVVIDHGGGFSTLYAHQSRTAAGDGAGVSQGQVIGYVGSTGNSTGPHLHFETRVGGSPQNPMRYLR
jgi:murein DD-endopeptidase MepM/ murein hydrolase activator NlpD